ncbi:MAG: hypothetical protein WDO73_00705 [Ignavibacteriota bacterium]
MTPAQLAAAIGPNSSVRIVQAASQAVIIVVPTSSGHDPVHVCGEVKNEQRKLVQAFEVDGTGGSALARSVPLRPGTYHVTVVSKNMASGQTVRTSISRSIEPRL